ncbi:MAG TPA: hypothetical protein VN931_00980 [Fibrobacteria bacterium]|nr:hypothetical protein [Fibrobacteria bacterium]
MMSRIPILALLLPALALASADPGDTLLSQSPNLDLGSWVIDGTKVSTQYKCTDLIPGTCSYSLTALDSIALLPGSPAGGVFLRVLSANSLSPVPTKRQATFVHGEWWRVKGKTGDWALEVDSSYFQSHYAADQMPDTLIIHPHWARIQPGRSWVKWVDTVKNQLLLRGNMGKIMTTETHLLRCLVDSSLVIDTIFGRLKAIYPISYPLGIHWSTGISLNIQDSSIPFFSSVLDSNGTKTFAGTFRGTMFGDSESLVAGTYVVWTANSGYIDPSSWQYPPSPTYPYDMVVSAFWTFRVAGATDSMVSLGIIPTGAFEGVIPRSADPTAMSLHAIDLAGRPVPLGNALPLGPHLATVEGRLQTVIVRP